MKKLGKARVSKADAYMQDRLDESFASSNLRRIPGLSVLKLKATARLTVLMPRSDRGNIIRHACRALGRYTWTLQYDKQRDKHRCELGATLANTLIGNDTCVGMMMMMAVTRA